VFKTSVKPFQLYALATNAQPLSKQEKKPHSQTLNPAEKKKESGKGAF